MKLPIAFALLSASSSVAATVLEKNPQGCIDPADYDADTDFFPQKFVPHETTDHFTIEYHNTYKILRNSFHTPNKSYLLYQCGTEIPEEEADEHHIVISVPHVGGIAITQTPQIPPMEMLAKRSAISAYIGNPTLVSSPCLASLMDDKTIETISYPDDPYNSTLLEQGTAEYLERNPEAIVFSGPTGGKEGNERYMAMVASQERSAVATFDHVGVYAALFNLEGMANEIVADTESRYQCSAANAAALTADIKQEDKPKILWANYFSSVPGWSVADCSSDTYYCEYAKHCGAEIMSRVNGTGFSKQYGSPTVYWYLSDEEFLEFGKNAETWIYPSQTFESVYEEKKEMLDQFKSVQQKNVYDTQGQGEYGWHEQRLAEYDVVALDMCSIVGTDNPNFIHKTKWFRKIDGEMGNPGVCDVNEIDLAYVPDQSVCVPYTGTMFVYNAATTFGTGTKFVVSVVASAFALLMMV